MRIDYAVLAGNLRRARALYVDGRGDLVALVAAHSHPEDMVTNSRPEFDMLAVAMFDLGYVKLDSWETGAHVYPPHFPTDLYWAVQNVGEGLAVVEGVASGARSLPFTSVVRAFDRAIEIAQLFSRVEVPLTVGLAVRHPQAIRYMEFTD